MLSKFAAALSCAAAGAVALMAAPLATVPAAAQPGGQGWRALCVPGQEVEILVGGQWYRGTAVGPDEFGDESCNVTTTAYTGREMRFAMAPDRMRAVGAAPGVAQPPPQAQQGPPARPSVTATLAEIGEAYRGNTVAARQRYEKRTVTLTGTLQSVGSDYIRLKDGPFGVAMCNFDEGQRAQLAGLQPGARLTVQGDDTSWGWDTFQLRSCRVLEQQAAAQPAPRPERSRADGRPPLGRYVCRQYMTTIGYIQLGSGGYTVNGVRGGYSLGAGGAIRWNGGAYAGWPARYEFSPGGGGHAHDEHIIRMTDEAGRLKIDCFLMDK